MGMSAVYPAYRLPKVVPNMSAIVSPGVLFGICAKQRLATIISNAKCYFL